MYEQQVLGIHQIAQIAQNEARMLGEFNLSHKLYEQGVLDMDDCLSLRMIYFLTITQGTYCPTR